MPILNYLPQLSSLTMHTKVIYSFAKVEKAALKYLPHCRDLNPLFQDYLNPIWSVHSLLKLTKNFSKSNEEPQKNAPWQNVIKKRIRDLTVAIKWIGEIVEVVQYNDFFLRGYALLGQSPPFQEEFLKDFKKLVHFTNPLKLYHKINCYGDAAKDLGKAGPNNLTERRLNYIQCSFQLTAEIATFTLWIAEIVADRFPRIVDHTPAPIVKAVPYFQFSIYIFKFCTALTRFYALYRLNVFPPAKIG